MHAGNLYKTTKEMSNYSSVDCCSETIIGKTIAVGTVVVLLEVGPDRRYKRGSLSYNTHYVFKLLLPNGQIVWSPHSDMTKKNMFEAVVAQ